MPELAETKTELLFWSDAFLKEFEAKILQITEEGVILNRTVFFPAGGGQLSDQGYLWLKKNKDFALRVESVAKNEQGVIHVIPNKKIRELKEGDEVVGRIDWARRYNLMRAHTSQHVFSAVILKLTDVETKKAIIEEEGVTIHLTSAISENKLKQAFIETNKRLLSNKEVKTAFFPPKSIPKEIKKALRGDLNKDLSQVRVVSVEGIDHSLCGGTHCKNTAEIGAIFLTNFKGDSIHYTFGDLALEMLATSAVDLIAAAKLLAAKPSEVRKRISTTLQELSEIKATNNELSKIALKILITELKNNPLERGAIKILKGDFHYAERKFVLQELGKLPENYLAIFIVKGPLLLVYSSSTKFPANDLIKAFSERTNNKGGGSPTIAQSSLNDPASDLEIMLEIINERLKRQ